MSRISTINNPAIDKQKLRMRAQPWEKTRQIFRVHFLNYLEYPASHKRKIKIDLSSSRVRGCIKILLRLTIRIPRNFNHASCESLALTRHCPILSCKASICIYGNEV